MNYVEPIRNKEDLNNLLRWAKDTGATENYLVLLVGFTSGLRVSDILNLRVGNVKDSDYIIVREQKTAKYKKFPLQPFVKEALEQYIAKNKQGEPNSEYLFRGITKIGMLHRSVVYRFLNDGCEAVGLHGNFGTHTMRKTFGYHHYKQFHDIAMLQEIFNHSSPSITKRYIGITQDEINKSYADFRLLGEDYVSDKPIFDAVVSDSVKLAQQASELQIEKNYNRQLKRTLNNLTKDCDIIYKAKLFHRMEDTMNKRMDLLEEKLDRLLGEKTNVINKVYYMEGVLEKPIDYTNDTPLLKNEQKILDLLMAGYDDKDILKMTKMQPQSLCKIICDICERWNVPTMQALLVKAFNKKITSLQTY